jgi:hypothetical protein
MRPETLSDLWNYPMCECTFARRICAYATKHEKKEGESDIPRTDCFLSALGKSCDPTPTKKGIVRVRFKKNKQVVKPRKSKG